MMNAKASDRRGIQTDFGTTTNETMKWCGSHAHSPNWPLFSASPP